MDRKHRDILITKRCELLENLNVGDGLFSELISRKILTPRQVRKIKNGKSLDEQAEDLLDILPTKGPLCFQEFCESLIANNQEHIVTLYLKPGKNKETRGQKRPRSPSQNKTPQHVSIKDNINKEDIVIKFLSSYPQEEKVTHSEKRQFVPNELRHSLKHFTVQPSGVEDFPRYIPVSDSTNGYHRHKNGGQNEPYLHHQRNISKGVECYEIKGRGHNAEGCGNTQLNTLIDKGRGRGQNSASSVNSSHPDIDYNQKNTSSDHSEVNKRGSGYEQCCLETKCQSSERCGQQESALPSRHYDHHSAQHGKPYTETNYSYTPHSKQSDSIKRPCTYSDNENLNTQRYDHGMQTRWMEGRSPTGVISLQSHSHHGDQECNLGQYLEHRISRHSGLERHPDHHINYQARFERNNNHQSNFEVHSSHQSSLERQSNLEHHSNHQSSLEHHSNHQSSLERHSNHQTSLERHSNQSSSDHHTNHQSSLEHHPQQSISHLSSSGHHLNHHISKDNQQFYPDKGNQPLSPQSPPHVRQNLEESLRRTEIQGIERRSSLSLHAHGQSFQESDCLSPNSSGQSFQESSFNPDAVRNKYRRNVPSNKDLPYSQTLFHSQCTEAGPPVSPDRVTRCDSIDTMHTVLPSQVPVPCFSEENLKQQVLVDNMVDNDIDLTDGPVDVRVESSTREFYLENYKQAYPMKKLPRGEALIINVKEIKGKPPRLGTDIDSDNMHLLLLQLHFNVTVYNDRDGLTAKELYEKILAFSASGQHKNSNACFVCLLSHGEEGYIYGTDGETVSLSNIFSLFDNNRCKSLCEKPKIFIVQACRGASFDRGVILDETDGSNSGKIPTLSDMIIGYPTQAGYYAWRNRERGSWYIEAIVQVFMKHAKQDDICTLLNRVNAVVSRKVSRAAVREMDQMSQMSEYTSSLRMPHVYLFPGIGSS